MNRNLLIIGLILINAVSISASDIIGHYLNFSYAYEFNKEDNHNISLGYELFFFDEDRFYQNVVGINFRSNVDFRHDDFNHFMRQDLNFSKFSIFYNFLFDFTKDSNGLMKLWDDLDSRVLFGLGANITYDFQNSTFGVGPQINLKLLIWTVSSININYRYNIYNNSKNFNEIEITFGFINVALYLIAFLTGS